MRVILKLIGHIITDETGKYFFEIRLNNMDIISFDVMKNLLTSYDIEDDDIQYLTITCDCKNIKCESVVESFPDEEKKVYIYTCKEKLRKQLEEIFITYGQKTYVQTTQKQIENTPEQGQEENNDESENKSDVDNNESESEVETEDDEPELDFTKINNEAKKLFEDTDFVFLLKTYLNKPELFKTFYKYISSGNILINGKESVKEIPHEELETSKKIISDLDLNFSTEEIEKALIHTGNHLNLSIRYLLFKKVEEKI